jgi:hypothetical protein
MAICLIQKNNKTVEVSTTTQCDFYALTPVEFSTFQGITGAINMTPEQILYVYTWGMGAILLPFSIALATKWAVKVVKSL